MKVSRAAALGVGGGLMAAWLAAAAGTRTAAPAAAVRPNPPMPIAVAPAIETEAERLRQFLDTPPLLGQASRNPFQFAPHAPRPAVLSALRSVPPAQPLVAPGPRLTLAGIAEDAGADGPVRTAIISAGSELFLVKEGASVTARYRVARIGADAVELEDVLAGTPVRIALK